MNNRKYYPVGTKVTCNYPTKPYEYFSIPEKQRCLFTPGMIGTIVDIAPKVRIITPDESHDLRSKFYCVDFIHNKQKYRVGLNHCNVKRIKNI